MSTLILGAGISGLLAAWHIQRRGEAVELWEAQGHVGGWVQTLEWAGPQGEPGHLERGPQGVLVAPGSPCDRLFTEIGLELHRPGHGARWLGRGGKLIPVPSHPMQLLTSPLLPLSAKLRMMLEPFQAVRPAEPEESMFDFAARRLGRGAAEAMLPAMVAGILAAPPQILSVDAMPKLREWEATGSMVKGMGKGGRSEMVVPKGGMGSLPKALGAKLPPVRTGLRADSLRREGTGWCVTGGGERRLVDRVILALPAFEAAALLGSAAPQSAAALSAMPYTSIKLYNSRHTALAGLKDGFGFLIHPPEGKGFLGALVPSWMDPDSAPAGLMQLRAFVGGAFPVAPGMDSLEGVQATLHQWVPELSEALQTRLVECPNAIPRAELGHRARLAQSLGGLPPGIDWISNARFGPGVRDLVEALDTYSFA